MSWPGHRDDDPRQPRRGRLGLVGGTLAGLAAVLVGAALVGVTEPSPTAARDFNSTGQPWSVVRTPSAPPPTTARVAPPSTSPTKSAAASRPTRTTPPADTDNVRRGTAAQMARVLELTNQERARAGCGPVAIESHLARAAGDFALHLATYDFVGHVTKDGIVLADRINAAGYRWSSLGENAAGGFRDADSVVAGWMKSPGHRANIVNCTWVHIGVGVAFRDDRGFWIQDFGKPA